MKYAEPSDGAARCQPPFISRLVLVTFAWSASGSSGPVGNWSRRHRTRASVIPSGIRKDSTISSPRSSARSSVISPTTRCRTALPTTARPASTVTGTYSSSPAADRSTRWPLSLDPTSRTGSAIRARSTSVSSTASGCPGGRPGGELDRPDCELGCGSFGGTA